MEAALENETSLEWEIWAAVRLQNLHGRCKKKWWTCRSSGSKREKDTRQSYSGDYFAFFPISKSCLLMMYVKTVIFFREV
jgi:hypothetical protein